MNFKMPGKVYRTAMSTLSTSHTLIAAGTEDVQVRLCDISSGAFAHTLSGHRGMSMLFILSCLCVCIYAIYFSDICSSKSCSFLDYCSVL